MNETNIASDIEYSNFETFRFNNSTGADNLNRKDPIFENSISIAVKTIETDIFNKILELRILNGKRTSIQNKQVEKLIHLEVIIISYSQFCFTNNC